MVQNIGLSQTKRHLNSSFSKQNITRDIEVKSNLTIDRGEWGWDSGEGGFQELLWRTHGQNPGGGWEQGREVGLAGVVGSSGEKMQTTVIEQQ